MSTEAIRSRTIVLAITSACTMVAYTPMASAQCEFDKLASSDGARHDVFGGTVAMDGAWAVIGAYWNDEKGLNAGAAYVFRYLSGSIGNWVQEAKLLASEVEATDWYGNAVAISGNVALIASRQDDDNGTNAGAAYVFRNDGSVWLEEAKLVASDGSEFDRFGTAVAISGDVAVIGANLDDERGYRSGAAYVFRHNGTTWQEEAKLLPPGVEANDTFGTQVAISGQHILVAAPEDDDAAFNAGAVYVFRYDPSAPRLWIEEGKLLPSDGMETDFFGKALALSPDFAVVGSRNSAYVYRRSSLVPATWIEEAKLVPGHGRGHRHCSAVAIEGNTVAIGFNLDDVNGQFSGSAYLFRRNGSQWVEEAEMLPSDGGPWDRFGTTLAMSGGNILVGTTMDQDHHDSLGAAYAFSLTKGDCDGNGVCDERDIALGFSQDCNTNWVPDQCEDSSTLADADGDGDIDTADFATFMTCYNGAQRPPANTCADTCMDLDDDGDVDVFDFLTFSNCFNGSLKPPKCP